MKKKEGREPLFDTRDLMVRFDRLLGRMAPKLDAPNGRPEKAVRRGRKKKPAPTSPDIS